MSERYRVSVVLPAYNEAGNIERVLRQVNATCSRVFADYEVIVVDDGSRDATPELLARASAADPRVHVITHPVNRGYGEALHSGFRAATQELIFFTDSDNQFDIDEIELLLPFIDRVDAVCGYRIDRQDPWRRRFMAGAWNVLVRALFYVPVRDIDCAFKLFRKSVFEAIDIESVGAMVNTELMVKIGRAGAGVVEVGVTHLPRTSGKPRGASPRVILTAFRELVAMRHRLRAIGPVDPRLSTAPHDAA